jgi:uncharacterized membrane protein YbhN (UPF0104 family)
MHEHVSERPSAVRRYGITVLKLAISIALLAFLFSRVDAARLWAGARRASIIWLIVALGVYGLNVITCTWRWHELLGAQEVPVRRRTLLGSFLVANFFNNFLPSNIGGDVIRIRDTAGPARSRTLATTIILIDRGLGLAGLVLIAALSATMLAGARGAGPSPIWPSWLWAGLFVGAAVAAPAVYAPDGLGRLLRPLTVLHPEWVGGRIETLTSTLHRFRTRPGVLVRCFAVAVAGQALMVLFYLAVVRALNLQVTVWDLAVIVPISFVVQMLPVSVNGFGVREATFSFYFTRLGVPIESAVLLSLVAAGLTMVFSLSGAAVYVSRTR